jgi:hypothetical protein
LVASGHASHAALAAAPFVVARCSGCPRDRRPRGAAATCGECDRTVRPGNLERRAALAAFFCVVSVS